MPKNFPEAWLDRVRQKLSSAVSAPWLEGVEELEGEVIVLASGKESEKNVIHVPTTNYEPQVFINNTTYPLLVESYTDDEVVLQLDKYQTAVTTLSDDEIIGAAYPRIDSATKSHTTAITKKKFGRAAHALAPQTNTANTPVIVTTGDLIAGRRRMVYEDLISLKDKLNLNDDQEGLVLVLCTSHWNDLLLDRKNFGDQLVNYKKGQVGPEIAGFELHPYIANPRYSAAGVKLPWGAVHGATDLPGSFAFVKSNVVKKTGLTKQYFRIATTDPDNQTNRLNYRHYFFALPVLPGQCGAILSAQS